VTLRLVTIGFSHYCEKARWALDRAGLPYVEESHAPILHVPAAMAAGRKRTVPILVDEHGKAFTDSTDILLEVDRRAPHAGLYPEDPALRQQVLDLEELLDRDLGPAARRVGYFHVLNGGATYGRELLASAAATPAKRVLVHAAYPLIARAIGRALRVDAEGFARSSKKLDDVFATVGERLEAAEREGRSWLVGDGFTAADLTLAALAVPVLAPDTSGFAFPPRSMLPHDAARLAERLAATRAGAHALRTLATERDRRA
jgi:glutathione S-transferase